MTHLNDISKIYLEQIAEKKDNSYLETDMKKRQKNNEKAVADMKKVKDDTVPRWMKEGAIADRLKAMAAEKKKDWDKKGEKAVADANKAMDKVKKTQKDMESSSFVQKESKKLDPVGQEDADIDNDGDVDKSDKYLHKKRKAIGKAISKKKGEDEEDDENVEESVVVTKRKTLGSRFKNDAERQAYLKKLDQKSKERRLNKLRATVEEVEEVEEVEQIDELRVTKLADKSKVKERAKNIKSIRDKKAALADLMKHYKGMKTGVYNSYEPEGEMVDEKIDVRKQSSKRKSLGRGSSINPDAKKTGYESPAEFRKTEKKLAPYVEEVEEVELDEKFKTQYGDKTKLSQSSERKSLGRGSSIKDGSKSSGYESKKEFRDQSMKLRKHRERFGDLAKEEKNIHGEVEVPSGNIGKLAKKASKRIDTDVDGDVEHNDKHKGEYGEFVPSPDGKKKVFTGPKKVTKESFSNWRQDLIEVADEDGEKQIKEMPKNQKNKISINPKLGEAVEGIGGTLLEEVEIDELDVIINTIYDEFLEEGYTEDEIEEAFEVVLLDEATVTYGHDSKGLEPKKQSKLQGRMRYIKRKVGEKLSAAKTKAKEKYGMASAKAQVAAYNKARELSQKGSDVKNRAKTSLKRFVKRQAQKVVDRMSEEVEQIDEKAVSKKQQRFMGMVYAAKKGEAPASAEVAKAAAGMSKKDAKDFASTKHKKLPEVKESMQGEVQMSPQEVQLQRKSAQIDKKLASIRQRKVQKQTSQQSQNKEV